MLPTLPPTCNGSSTSLLPRTQRETRHVSRPTALFPSIGLSLLILVVGAAVSIRIAVGRGGEAPELREVEVSAADEPQETAEGSAHAPEPVAPEGETESTTEPALEPEREPEREPFAHTVQAGDSLWRIATDNDCTVAELRAANQLDGDVIYAGQTLVVPACSAEPAARPEVVEGEQYEIQAGDYLELIASNVGCTVSELMSANEMRTDVIYAGQMLSIPTCEGADVPIGTAEDAEGFVTVQSGDILGVIAERQGCAVSELMAVNTLANANAIRVGQRLRVPEGCTGRPVAYTVRTANVEGESLEALMLARGFSPPQHFKALIVEITFTADRSGVRSERRFDWRGTSDDDDGWNPASSVKIFAGIAAAQYARELGFSDAATVTFHGAGGDRSRRLSDLLQAALGPSDNIAYNELVQFVGFDRMNGTFLSRGNNLSRTGLRRAYERRRWMEMGESPSFMVSPPISITEGGRTRDLDAREGSVRIDCGNSACTSLNDLAEAMRRLMLQEQLASNDHFGLDRQELRTIRRALRTTRRRGEEVVSALRGELPPDTRFYHKAGFSLEWYSDVVYISPPASNQAWIVALAGYPGRNALNGAAEVIGQILASGDLERL